MAAPTWRTKPLYSGRCDGCGWTVYSQNAFGLSAQHYVRCGGKLYLDQSITFVWEDPKEYAARRAAQEANDSDRT